MCHQSPLNLDYHYVTRLAVSQSLRVAAEPLDSGLPRGQGCRLPHLVPAAASTGLPYTGR